MNNRQMYDDNQNLIFKQDEKLDMLINEAEDIKEVNIETGKELKKQDKLIKNLDKGMDDVNNEMKKADGKLNKIIVSQSYWKLYIFIFIELIGMIILLII